MLAAKRPAETNAEGIPSKRLKKDTQETIQINPALEETIVPDLETRNKLGSCSQLTQDFSTEQFTLHSPNVVTYTNCGQIPHVTADLAAKFIKGEWSVIGLQSVILTPGTKILEKHKKSLGQLIATTRNIILTPYSSYEQLDLTNFNDQNSMSIWNKGGRKKISTKEYFEFVQASAAQLCVCLSDVVPSSVSRKRADKSCFRTLNWVDEMVARKGECPGLDTLLIAPIPGSGYRDLTLKSAKLLAQKHVFGYLIERATLPTTNWRDLVKDVISLLPPQKPVFMFGVLNESELVEAYNCGCHFVDTSFVTHVADLGHALTLHPRSPSKLNTPTQQTTTLVHDTNFGPDLTATSVLPEQELKHDKKPKQKKGKEPGIFATAHYLPTRHVTLDLNCSSYSSQFTALVVGCTCFTCARHTRGYVNHLLVTKELLAPTLLSLHNTTRVEGLVEEVRERAREGTLGDMAERYRELYYGLEKEQ